MIQIESARLNNLAKALTDKLRNAISPHNAMRSIVNTIEEEYAERGTEGVEVCLSQLEAELNIVSQPKP